MRFYDKLLEHPQKGFVSDKSPGWIIETRYLLKSYGHTHFLPMWHRVMTPKPYSASMAVLAS